MKCVYFCYERYFERQIMKNWSVMVYDHLRIDYCGFGPFCSTRTKLLLSFSLLKVYICIIY